MDQQVDAEDMFASQIPGAQPEALPGFLDVATEGLPTLFFGEPQTGIGFLAQGIEPMQRSNCLSTPTGPNSQSPTRKTAAPAGIKLRT